MGRRHHLPNQHCRTFAGWVYAAFVIDVFSRRVVGWQLSTSLRANARLQRLKRGPLDNVTNIDMGTPGLVVLLNGPSSSGKSSIGRAMLPLLDDPWFLLPVDRISGLRSTVHRRQLNDPEIQAMLMRTRRRYHRAVAALASCGNDVIMDYPLSEPWRLSDLLAVLAGYDVTMIDVRCSPRELARREHARADRPPGLAASQSVYGHADRDLEVDTTATSPEDCAGLIVNRLTTLTSPKAFERLRRRGS